jgi:hypothetical protein
MVKQETVDAIGLETPPRAVVGFEHDDIETLCNQGLGGD